MRDLPDLETRDRIIHMDEEWMIATTVCRILGITS